MIQTENTPKEGKWQQLNSDDRAKIEHLLEVQRKGIRKIARELNRAPSTIKREIARGTTDQLRSDLRTYKRYFAETGEAVRKKKRSGCGTKNKLGEAWDFVKKVENLILEGKYSPEAAVILAHDEEAENQAEVSARTIYNYIEQGLLKVRNIDLLLKVRRKPGKKYKLAKRCLAGTSIEERPVEIENREEFGHWEADTVHGSKEPSSESLATIVERNTRLCIIRRIDNLSQDKMVNILDELEKENGLNFAAVFKSITTDNGSEFADCSGLENSVLKPETKRTTIYRAHPYSAYERGTNENTNGIIRRFIPKGTDIGKLSDEFLNRVENWINTLPRKILGYASAQEMYNRKMKNIAICPIQALPG